MSFINISGKKIYYESYGENHTPVLVYLHGGPGASCLDFTNTAKALGKQIKVVSFDQYGVLRSEIISDNEPYTMEIQAKLIDEMRRKMNIKSWSVLGHSYGGALAVLYADKYPDTVDKIILECPCLDFTDSAKSIAAYLSDYIFNLGDKTAISLCERIQNYNDQNNDVVVDILNLLEYVKEMELRNYLHSISFDKYISSFSTIGITDDMWAKAEKHLIKLIEDGAITKNYLPILKKLNKPILLLKGKYDPACSDNQVNYINDLPNATIVEFEKSGHFPRIEEQEKYIETVLNYLL
ncbi:MAG: alpha/beta fold hydrolase [Acutalibacteraceae bacterium]|uniref:alpha/beta fold hydrolase n=1 Tax=Ruminococcus sp. TaxID=41978 RepID=UPI002E7769F4|nr:alpha/beta fold hydrolase [Ruminococcus sp.]MEE1057435.1 alpha/beta fold hydrolase [Acutalibacteraceae bacterium]MEE1263723.1 alpha/beta fold hydrolase [Ruminococcus sp.]